MDSLVVVEIELESTKRKCRALLRATIQELLMAWLACVWSGKLASAAKHLGPALPVLHSAFVDEKLRMREMAEESKRANEMRF